MARFAKQVLGDDSQEADKLLADVQTRVAATNATPLRYGFGRLDAIGNIFNKVATVVNAPGQTFHASDAPVSYPFLWNIHQLNAVQWNASAPNGPVVGGVALGALGRNTGEVIGEFSGDLQTEPYPLALLRPGYKSSVDITMKGLFPSAAERDRVAEKYGAVEGAKQTLARLAEHLATMG